MVIPPERQQEIIQALTERKALLPCPRCRNQQFHLMDGYFSLGVQSSPFAVGLGGSAVPYVMVVCNRCGFMSPHALGVLGLLSGPNPPVVTPPSYTIPAEEQ